MSNLYAETMPPKHPNAVKDYDFDWSAWLPAGDAIASYTVAVDPGITIASDSQSGAVVKVWLSGGTDTTVYGVRCTITTTNTPARVEVREMRVWVRA